MQDPAHRPNQNHSSRGQNNKSLSLFNVFRPNKYIFLLFWVWLGASALIGIAQAEGKLDLNIPTSPYAIDKLVDSEDILTGFEEGETWVKVIVSLAKPEEVLEATVWDSEVSLNKLHAEIRARQEEVLSTLSHNEFALRNRLENQPTFSGEVTLEGLNKLLDDPRVEFVEPVYLEEINLADGIPLINGMVYRSTYNGSGVAIAITDTGIDYTHPKLGGGGFPNSKVIGGYDFGDDDSDPIPNGQEHGTCCAGIAAGDLGTTGDYIGGVAPNAKLYALKVTLGSGSSASSDDIIAAWDWCVSHKNDDPTHPILVISHSMGGGRYYSLCDSSNSAYATAANNATAAGITVLSSSGNSGYCDSIGRPECLSGVISVGAVYDAAFGTYNPCVRAESCATKYSTAGCSTGWYASDTTTADMVTSYSNTASFLDILAPANMAYTTDIVGSSGHSTGDYHDSFGGTSAACPYAAGAVACLQSAAQDVNGSYLSPSEIRDILILTGDDITDGKVAITKPRINLGDAIGSFVPVVCCPTTISSYPYSEDFEGEASCGVTCGTPCPLSGDWTNDNADDHDWTVDSGGTTSGSTGPSVDHNPGTSGGKYLYTESSSGCNNSEAILLSPCFDLSSLSNPELRFWYHMYGSTMGTLTVELSDDDCASWVPVWTLSGDQGNVWYEAVVDLSTYIGSTIKIRFVGMTGNSYYSDMAIDDIHVEDVVPQPSLAKDVNVSTSLNTPVTITLEASDDGYPNPPGILTYIVTSLPGNGTLSDPYAGDISSVPYTLVNNGNQAVYTPDSEYTGPDSFQFKANDSGVPPDGGDSNIANVSIDVISALYIANMDTDPIWSAIGQWQFGVPTGQGGTSSGNPDPTSGYTGSKVYGVNLNGDYSTSAGGPYYLTTQAINCSGYTDVHLTFYRWLNSDYQTYVYATLEVSNNGSTWTTIWENGGSPAVTDNSWQLMDYDINSVAVDQATVYVRWGYEVSGGAIAYSGWNIDDVAITGTALSPEPPAANDINVSTPLNTAVTITLEATDEGLPDPPGALSYIITSLPSNGELNDPSAGTIVSTPYTLSGNGDQVVYTPDPGFMGSDSFQYKANDGGTTPEGGDSNLATVSIEVGEVTVEYQVSSSNDDAYAYGSTSQNLTTFYLKVGYHSSYGVPYYMSGMCFRNVNIPKGATITSAYLKIQSYTSYLTNTVYGQIQAEDTDDADGFSGRYMAGLAKTTASVDWDHSASWSADTWYTSPDVAGVVQEVIDRPGWSANNSLAIFYSTRIASGSYRYFSSYDRGSTYAPKLEISYTSPVVVGVPPEITSIPVTTATVNQPYSYDVDATGTPDPNYSLTTAPLGMTINPTTGLISWTPDSTQLGLNAVTVVAGNGQLPDATQSFSIDVAGGVVCIFGYCLEPDGNTPVEGVLISTDNNDVNSVTDPNGYYQFTVDYGWSGAIEPNKTGYTFEPNGTPYSNVTTDQNDNYIAILDTFIISGYAVDSEMLTSLEGVLVSPDNDGGSFTSKYYGGSDTTDVNGYYEVLVDYNWSGKIAPSKYAYVFEPNSITYANVTEDVTEEQDYVGTLLTYTITGYIKNSYEVPIEGILVDANNGGGQDTTDPNGFYEVWVDYNWSGTVTPTKKHYTFDPNWIPYTNVLEDWIGGDYIAANMYDLDCDGSIGFGDLADMCGNWLKTGPDVPGDFYKDDDHIVNFLDFAEFALIWQEQ